MSVKIRSSMLHDPRLAVAKLSLVKRIMLQGYMIFQSHNTTQIGKIGLRVKMLFYSVTTQSTNWFLFVSILKI